MSYAFKKFTPGKSVPRSKESIDAENATYDAEMKRYQANAAFLAKVAEGDHISLNAQIEEEKAAKYSNQYPFQGRTFESNPHTFQPQLTHYSYIDLSPASEAEKKEAMDQLKAFTNEIAAQKVYQANQVLIKAAWQMKIAADERRAMENVNCDYTLCKRCVVERPDEQVPESDQ
jgi:hypothetical protein